MPSWLLILLFICACAGIVCEIITLIAPHRIMAIMHDDPEKIMKNRFYLFIFLLSGPYLLIFVLLLVSGVKRFIIYGIFILCLSILGLLFKSRLKDHIYLVVAESTVCLIILLDIIRNILKTWGVL